MFGKKKSADAADYRAVVRELDAHGRDEETDAYLALNSRVHEAARRLPWHRR